jgi:queuine tRNA-ribosyltransferase/7-cyano-7-deazaguanine tRNA-ribosyltransferase
MIRFEVVHQSSQSWARVGILETAHGTIETPAFVPVATQAAIKALPTHHIEATGSQLLIANTFHLHLRPGEDTVATAGGLHSFMQWPKPLMTDSGGFQVFSLGFGRDMQVGKVRKAADTLPYTTIERGTQPSGLTISDDGVHFRSPLDGKNLFIGPKESIAIQQKLGADIIFAFDECTPPFASEEYLEKSLERTHRWAKECQGALTSQQALFGIVQGSHIQGLREQSAQFINSLDFPGFGIGGELGESKEDMDNVLAWTIPRLSAHKPRHLLGIGYLDDMERIVRRGIDLFDCTVPTHYARRGIGFTSQGRINVRQSKYVGDFSTLDKACSCVICQTYSRAYLCHLFRAKEVSSWQALTFHNLHFFNAYIAQLRQRIRNNDL